MAFWFWLYLCVVWYGPVRHLKALGGLTMLRRFYVCMWNSPQTRPILTPPSNLSLPAPNNACFEQVYNSGSAPFPYAAECTVNSSVCDTSELMSRMEIAEQTDPISLDIASTADGDNAVELVRIDWLVD